MVKIKIFQFHGEEVVGVSTGEVEEFNSRECMLEYDPDLDVEIDDFLTQYEEIVNKDEEYIRLIYKSKEEHFLFVKLN